MIEETPAKAYIISLQVGTPRAEAYGNKEVLTAIFKESSDRAHKLSITGLDGDEQGDKVHHGGPDKAVCVYLERWYPYWNEQLERPLEYGSFGENITVSEWTEDDLCIGDKLQLGSAVVQVSQPRQPCFKLGIRNGLPSLPEQVIKRGNTGFYLRVLEEGEVRAGDELTVLKRHPARKSVAEANRLMYNDKNDQAGLEALLAVEELAESWRGQLGKRLAKLRGDGQGGQSV